MNVSSKLTILFEQPFWIGIYERTFCGNYEVCKITFGSEPKDYQVYDFLLRHWGDLNFSPPIQADVAQQRHSNPKRIQREIHSQLQERGIGTKAQQALKLQHEQGKFQRKSKSREDKEAEKQRQYKIRQEKKKKKHKGH
ncbi:YjdF family protein [[Clostridium] leptum]|uniref:DUF2992 domain-containing protein n=1 Tax=Solibaculum mannosilyticum TaxID=2780922 RepID=A0A7I8D087_9FIRM|nr:YjdF family protein [Solibaculum mannosilyticum]MCO7137032.1 YjdF family protein [[Clostridium] leptum]BCI60180.1 hypothetical protein C12CBH8_08190 [Solibaculum mannosilyticum]